MISNRPISYAIYHKTKRKFVRGDIFDHKISSEYLLSDRGHLYASRESAQHKLDSIPDRMQMQKAISVPFGIKCKKDKEKLAKLNTLREDYDSGELIIVQVKTLTEITESRS